MQNWQPNCYEKLGKSAKMFAENPQKCVCLCGVHDFLCICSTCNRTFLQQPFLELKVQEKIIHLYLFIAK